MPAKRGMLAAMAVHVYQYPKCSTCRKALAWLDDHRVGYTKSDLVADPIPVATLRDLHRRSGLPIARFFNTSGESYRAGNFKERLRTMSEGDALRALAADGKLVKRPIVDAGARVFVGFDAEALQEGLKS
jgi:arsenate reductase